MFGGASRMAIRLACPWQWVMSDVCTDFHISRSTVPSGLRAAVIRSGTAIIVTSSAMTRPRIPRRADSAPSKSLGRTSTGAVAARSI